jgi:flagellar assembly factor FliW
MTLTAPVPVDIFPEAEAAATPRTVPTSRFGDLQVAPGALITFADGLLGLPHARHFVAVPHGENSPFVWLQSADDPDLAFLLVPPALVAPDYSPPLPADIAAPNDPQDTIAWWAIITVPAGRPRDMTANLLGPLVIVGNAGWQIVLEDAHRYAARHRVFPPAGAATAATSAATGA